MYPIGIHARPFLAAVVLVAAVAPAPRADAQEITFKRGDANQDGILDFTDSVEILQVLFLSHPSMGCDDAADANDDGRRTITDAVWIMRYLFLGGKPPAPPFQGCGTDPTEDALGCLLFTPCLPENLPCVNEAQINQLMGTALQFSFCLPADILSLPSDQLTITVCPASEAKACGTLQEPGCPAEITSGKATLDTAARKLSIRIEGRVTDLPILVKESLFNTSAVCLTDFHGASPELPFSFDLVIPLVLEEVKPGEYLVKGTEEIVIENVVVQITASGGLLCTLFQAAQAVVVEPLMTLMETTLKSLVGSLQSQLVGVKVCATGG